MFNCKAKCSTKSVLFFFGGLNVKSLFLNSRDLKDMTVDEIFATFDMCKAALQDFFHASEHIPDNTYVPTLTVNQYLLVLNELLSPTQQQQMYLKIRSEFASPLTVDHITSDVCFNNDYILLYCSKLFAFIIFNCSMKICSGRVCCQNGHYWSL